MHRVFCVYIIYCEMYLMHMHLRNDVAYQEGAMHLKNMCLILNIKGMLNSQNV